VPTRRCLTDDDPDYLLIYAACALWSLLFGVFTPSVLGDLAPVQIGVDLLMFLAGASALGCLYGVWSGDKLGLERTALLGCIIGFGAYAITQVPLTIVYLVSGNTDRLHLAVLAWLPVLFLNRRRRFLGRRRAQVSALAHLRDGVQR
jgi:hypothetical protein